MNQIQDSGVKVRVYNIAHQNYDGEQDLGNCLLAQLVPDAAEEIVAVKVDEELLRATQDPEYNERVYFSQLDYLNLGNCSEVLLASGGTVYMSEPEVAAQIRERFFATQPDHCVRYGSLLVSSCKEGIVSLDRPLVVRIVDFEHENDLERKVAKSLRTGDCHGKISPRLATMLGGASDTPFQFRLANADYDSPLPAFIAKGTVAVDIQRTDNRGYDLVLDRSSIKGWAKNTGGMKVSQFNHQWRLTPKDNLTPTQAQDWGYLPTILQNQGVLYQIDPKDRSYILNNPPSKVLDDLAHIYDWGLDRIACGTYQLPGLVIGNNSNAQIQEYKNSWQLMQWYSPAAIENDIVPPTLAEAEYLKTIQNDYRLLSQYIVTNHDKKQQLKSIDEAELEVEEQEDKDEFGLIAVLRNDTRGELAYHPKVVSFCKEQLRKKWLELATKGTNTLLSAMAQPAEIERGTVVAPHLEHGTEVIVTRYPIINKDNIRRYLVDNEQAPELMATKGCVFIHPQDAMDYHQCDFDGDQLVCTPTDLLPTIAAETRVAKPQFDETGNDINRDFAPVIKKDKQPYTQTSLKQMALAVRLNSIGKIANAVGRVNCARPNPEADLKDRQYFLKMKQELLEALFDSLQIEADSPKSATRYTDYYPGLDKCLESPPFKLPFFDFKQDERVFNSAPMPVAENGSVVDILPRSIERIWSSCELKQMKVEQFKYLLPRQESNLDEVSKVTVEGLAQNILQQYNDTVRTTVKEINPDPKQIKQRFGRLYSSIKEQIAIAMVSSTAKDELAALLWQKQHSNDAEGQMRRKCLDICRHFDPSLYCYQKTEHEYQRDLRKQPAYIIDAPFESSLFANQGRRDCAKYIKEILEFQGQDFEASLHPTKPCVQFAVKNIDVNLKQLFEPFNNPAIARQHDLLDIQQAKSQLDARDRGLYNKLFTFSTGINKYNPVRITAPRHMDWVLGQRNPKASLVFSVLPERITKALGREISKVEVLGKDQNAYATHDFSSPYYQGRELNFTVLPYNDPNSDRHGDPIVYMQNPGDGNYYSLGMFARESSKLPRSTTFTGQVMMNGRTIDLFIKPGSILVPEVTMPPSPKKQKSKSWRQEMQANQRDNARRLALIKSRRLSLSKTRSRPPQTKSQSENQFEL